MKEAEKKAKEKEAKEERETLERKKKFLKKVEKKLKYMRPEYQEKVKKVLDEIQLAKPTAATLARLERMKAFFEDPDNGEVIIPKSVSKALERLTKTPFSDLTEAEQDAIVTAIQSYVTLNNLKTKLIIGQRYRELKSAVDEAVRNIEKKDKLVDFNSKDIDFTSRDVKHGAAKKIFTTDSYDLEMLAQLLDNKAGNTLDDSNGIIHRLFYGAFNEGSAEMFKYQFGAIDTLKEAIGKTNIEGWSEHFQKKSKKVDYQTINLTKGKTIKLTKAQRMNIYLNSQNMDNVQHMILGGISPRNSKSVIYKITFDDLKLITDSLTPEEKRIANKMLELVNVEKEGSIREGLNRVSTMLNGYPIA
jgi:hypothetical protein